MKLLNYSSAYLAGILLLALSIFTAIFYWQMLDEIYDSLDDGLDNQKLLVIKRAKKDPSILGKETFQDGYYTIHQTKFEAVKNFNDVYTDTLMYMENEDDKEPVRLLKTAFTENGKFYRLNLITSMVEEDDLIEDLLYSILWLYIGLISSILILNNWVFRKTWRPFYKLLKGLKNFQIENEPDIEFQNTSIYEFDLLNQNIERLLDKSTEAYRNQKEFIENASHELQTPLAISINKLELLAEHGNLTQNQVEQLEAAMANLDRMSRLNKSLLMLSKIENKQFINQEKLTINVMVKNLIKDFEDFAEFKKISFELKEENHKLIITFNPDLIQILLVNLFKNAVQHSPEHSIIEVVITKDGIWVNNEGMQEGPLDHRKLFSRFYKQNATSASTGLGLAISKTIADRYGFKLQYTFDKKHSFHLKVNNSSIDAPH